MEINGKKANFKRTIWATMAVAAICPDRDISRVNEVMKSDFVDGNMAAAQFIALLSEGYERAAKYAAERRGESYEMDPITLDDIMNLEDWDVFQQLLIEAVAAWNADGQQTVHSAPSKKKKQAKRSS